MLIGNKSFGDIASRNGIWTLANGFSTVHQLKVGMRRLADAGPMRKARIVEVRMRNSRNACLACRYDLLKRFHRKPGFVKAYLRSPIR
jgi:hypothetical protein